MVILHELLKTVGLGIVYVASDPIFFLIAILIVYMYKREAYKIQSETYLKKVSYTAVKDIVRGALIGILVSSIFTSLGFQIPLDQGMIILIPISLFFMFFNPKLGCFSYVVPFVYLISELLRYCHIKPMLLQLSYKELLLLIGILHILEGLLVRLYGDENCLTMPIYQNKHIVRAQILRKFWAVPLLIFSTDKGVMTGIPIYAILCYTDICAYQFAKTKKKIMGTLLIVYGLMVIILAYFILKNILPLGIGMLSVPILHESMFVSDKQIEKMMSIAKKAKAI